MHLCLNLTKDMSQCSIWWNLWQSLKIYHRLDLFIQFSWSCMGDSSGKDHSGPSPSNQSQYDHAVEAIEYRISYAIHQSCPHPAWELNPKSMSSTNPISGDGTLVYCGNMVDDDNINTKHKLRHSAHRNMNCWWYTTANPFTATCPQDIMTPPNGRSSLGRRGSCSFGSWLWMGFGLVYEMYSVCSHSGLSSRTRIRQELVPISKI